MADLKRSFNMHPTIGRIFDIEKTCSNTNATDALHGLIADGLRWRMHHNEPSVRNWFSPEIPDGCHPLEFETSDYILDTVFPAFLEAVAEQAGVVDNDAFEKFGRNRYRFEQVPGGGRWERAGVAGEWAILPRQLRLTVDGFEFVAQGSNSDETK